MTEEIKLEYAFGIPYEKLPSYRVKEPIGAEPVRQADEVNHELLDEILAFIKAHPQTWLQESWYKYIDPESGDSKYYVTEEQVTDAEVCGTAFCFAGHVAIHEGFPLPPTNSSLEWHRTVVDDYGPTYEDVWEFAQKVLGLTEFQADVLFASENSIEDLENYVKILHEYPNLSAEDMQEVNYNMQYNNSDVSVAEAVAQL